MNKKIIDRLLELANVAFLNDEIPVSAIIVKDNEIIGEGINTKNATKNILGHAEINAINAAIKNVGDWRLDDCDIYVTLLPCLMCTGVILESRIRNVYYLCNKTNVCYNISEFISVKKINSEIEQLKYVDLLQKFFKNKRN